MTREEAIKRLAMGFPGSIEEGKKYGQAVEMAISALSTEGEYIKKEDTIEYLNDLFGEMCHVSFGNVLQSIDSLQTYSFPDSAENKARTNGGAIISLYPDLKYTIQNGRVVTTIGVASSFDLDWWNAPYKAEREE